MLRCYQKLLRLDPSAAKRYKKEYERMKGEAINMAKDEVSKAVQVLGFGVNSYAIAIIAAETRSFRSKSVHKFIEYAGFTARSFQSKRYNRLLKKAVYSLALTAIMHHFQPWGTMYGELRMKLPHHKALNRVATKLLKEAFRAIRAG